MSEQQQKIDDCYAIENDKDALACLKELVSSAEGNCRPKLVLLTQEGCLPCSEEKAFRQKDIDKGIIQELSIDTQEGFDVAAKNEIEDFPALVLLDCDGKLIYPSGGKGETL